MSLIFCITVAIVTVQQKHLSKWRWTGGGGDWAVRDWFAVLRGRNEWEEVATREKEGNRLTGL